MKIILEDIMIELMGLVVIGLLVNWYLAMTFDLIVVYSIAIPMERMLATCITYKSF